MIRRNLLLTLFLSVMLSIIVVSAPSSLQDWAYVMQNSGLVAGRNVNMVSGSTWPDGDPFLQRQNEPSIAVSSVNVKHLLAGANDYRTVDYAGLQGEEETGDAWLGVYKSTNGGESWVSELLPGYLQDSRFSPLKGMEAAADPTVRAGLDGYFFYSGIAFQRIKNGKSVVFVARYRDYNDVDRGDPIQYLDTTVIEEGTSGQFTDKPWLAVDIPRVSGASSSGNRLVYIVYSVFLGNVNNNVHSKIMFARSTNGGETWEKSIKLSESEQKNNGTIIAIDPNDGTIYVAWRRYSSSTDANAIMIARSTDFGNSFTKAVEVATFSEYERFDQPTEGYFQGLSQFRTNALPTMAVDHNGRIYVAWTQRGFDLHYPNDARIVITSLAKGQWGQTWPAPVPVESPIYDPSHSELGAIHCHQFMPSLAFGARKLLLAWHDTRYSARHYDEYRNPRSECLPGVWISDDQASNCNYRETLDVRVAEANPGDPLNFGPSQQVSRFYWILDEDGQPRQAQWNAANYQLFSGGLVPFQGDYLDISPAPSFIKDGNSWRFNTRSEDPFVFYVSWTDNRDVLPPDQNIWTTYKAPDSTDCVGEVAGMRNQNVYVSKITRGVEVGTYGNNKVYSATVPRSFVVYLNNTSDTQKSFVLSIQNQPEGGYASFSNEDHFNTSLQVSVPSFSSATRPVFIQSPQPHTTVILVSEIGGSGFTGDILLNLVETNAASGENHAPSIVEYDSVNWAAYSDVVNHNIINPDIVDSGIDPNIVNLNSVIPNILNPNIRNPNIRNPNIRNPNIRNNIINPNIRNDNILNPNIRNPNIRNAGPNALDGALIIDKTWSVTNGGDAISSYTLKTIAGDSLPSNFWIFTQLLVYKIHWNPTTDGCSLTDELHHELILNIVNPNLSPDISSIDKITNPELDNSEIWNATFSLYPEEEALIVLRVIDTKILKLGATFKTMDSNQSYATENFADNVGAVVISHAPDENGNRQVAITLQILPRSLPVGLVGTPYRATLEAIGGDGTYNWDLSMLPSWLTATVSGPLVEVIGTPSQGGDYAIPVSVTDSTAPEAQSDTHTFVIHVEEPLRITTEPPLPNGQKGTAYSDLSGINFKFEASGGEPPYSWSWSGAPIGLDLDPVTGEVTGIPEEAGDFEIIVTVVDQVQTDAAKMFDLCIKPLPLDIAVVGNSSTVPEGYLGASYNVILVASGEGNLTWEITGLPSGLEFSPSGDSIAIFGTPVYDENASESHYPKTYALEVKVTDGFSASCYPGPITVQKSFDLLIHAKNELGKAVFAGDGDDEAMAVAVDAQGNVFVTGYSTSGATGKDIYTVKYDTSLQTQKAEARYEGPLEDQARAITIDPAGNVYVTGFSTGETSGPDYFTVKYDNSLNKLWEARYDGPSRLGDVASALAVDSAGNVYVTGYSYRGNQQKHSDYATVKYDSSGNLVWEERYDARRNGDDAATAIAIDLSGNVYVTGRSQESLNTQNTQLNFDYFTLKYDSSGQLLHEARYDGPGFGDDEARDIAIDREGNIYVTGRSKGLGGDFDYCTVKYDSVLNRTAEARFEGGNVDEATDIAIRQVNGSTYIYVTGFSSGNTGHDYLTIKYDSSLEELWQSKHDAYNSADAASALVVDAAGNVFVTGFSTKQSQSDYLTLKYDNDGKLIWFARYDGESGDDRAAAIALAVDSSDAVFVTGFRTGKGKDIATVKY